MAIHGVGCSDCADGTLVLWPTHLANRRALFRQGRIYHALLAGMRKDWAKPLMDKFYDLLQAQALYREVFGII